MKYLMMSALLFTAIPVLHGEESKIPAPKTPASAPAVKTSVPAMQETSKVTETPKTEEMPKVEEPPKAVETPEVKEIPAAAEAPKAEAAPVEIKPLGCVAHLTDLISFHQAEILNMKKIIQRWNDKVGATVKRKQDMEKEILDIGKQIDELTQSGDKKNKKEIARLQKQSGRISKELKVIGKEMKAECKELAVELKEVSKESQTALKERFQGIIKDIQETEK